MTLEATLFDAINPIVTVYPDQAPQDAALPYATYQQVGGAVVNPIGSDAPALRNARVQVNVWAATRVQASDLMRSVEDALRAAPIHGRPMSALLARKDALSELRGAQQDFSIWWQ